MDYYDDVGAIMDEVTELVNESDTIYIMDDLGLGTRRLVYGRDGKLVGDIYFDPDRATVTATKLTNFDGNIDIPLPDPTTSTSELYCDPDFFKKIVKLVSKL